MEEDDVIAPDFPVRHAFGTGRTVTASPTRSSDDPDEIEGDPDSDGYLIGDWYAPTPHRPLHSTRCVAINKGNGERCRQWAVVGFERCVTHSGYGKLANLAQYRERIVERARLDLLKGAPYAVERLVELARDRDINPAVSLKASETILDRIGVKGGADLNVTITPEGASPSDIIRARLDRLAAISSAPPSPSAGESEIVEAEVIGDDEPDD